MTSVSHWRSSPRIIPALKLAAGTLPSGSAFPNGPNWGRDVFIPLDWVIGGKERVGQGWRMLMECLAAGPRDLLAVIGDGWSEDDAAPYVGLCPEYANSSAFRLRAWMVSRSPLARIAEAAYVNEAARAVTAAMIVAGEKPSVISALMKYQTTERMRQAVNDAMDIHGGRAICDGPSNYLQAAYQMVPVGITVEGANILTRTLITFTQGALRSHPYLYREIQAAQHKDRQAGFGGFRRCLQPACGLFRFQCGWCGVSQSQLWQLWPSAARFRTDGEVVQAVVAAVPKLRVGR